MKNLFFSVKLLINSFSNIGFSVLVFMIYLLMFSSCNNPESTNSLKDDYDDQKELNIENAAENIEETDQTDTKLFGSIDDWSNLCWSEYIIQYYNPHWLHAVLNLYEYNSYAENVQVYEFGSELGRKDLLPNTYNYLIISNKLFGNELLFISTPNDNQIKTERFSKIDYNIESVFSHSLLLNNETYYIVSIIGNNAGVYYSISLAYYPLLLRFISLCSINDLQGISNYEDFIKEFELYFANNNELTIDSIVGSPSIYSVSTEIIHIEGGGNLIKPHKNSCDEHIFYTDCNNYTPIVGNELFRNWAFNTRNIKYTPVDNIYRIGKDIKENFYGITEIGFRMKDSVGINSLELCAVTYWDICTKITDGLMSIESYTLSGKEEVVSVFGYDSKENYNYLIVISRTDEEYFTDIYQEYCGASGCCSLIEIFLLDDSNEKITVECRNYEEFVELFPTLLEEYKVYLDFN